MASQQQKTRQLARMKRRPSVPGEVVADILSDSGLSQGQLAERLGVSRKTVNELVLGKRAVTPDMAHRLGRVFGNGPGLWLSLQQQVDMWDALHMDQTPYKHIQPLRLARATTG